jgi:hypothetical protein
MFDKLVRRPAIRDGIIDPDHPLAATVIAIVAVYNEAAVIEAHLDHAAEQGLGVYLMDNHSTDGTLEIARAHRRDGLLGYETYPAERSGYYEFARLLRRKAEIAATLPSRWAIHADADEFLEALEPDESLADALGTAERAGCSAVRFRYVEFRPWASRRFPERSDPRRLICDYTLVGHPAHATLTRAFRAGIDVDLSSSGGHEARFPGRRTYPWRQILRHYPIRDLAHAHTKILGERQERYLEEERAIGWHSHYDGLDPRSLLADGIAVERWDSRTTRALLRAEAAAEIEAGWIDLESAASSPPSPGNLPL